MLKIVASTPAPVEIYPCATEKCKASNRIALLKSHVFTAGGLVCREAQDNGDYARAFWLCAECCNTMASVASLKVAQQLNDTINQLYQDTISRLEGALQAVCNDFRPDQYAKVSLLSLLHHITETRSLHLVI